MSSRMTCTQREFSNYHAQWENTNSAGCEKNAPTQQQQAFGDANLTSGTLTSWSNAAYSDGQGYGYVCEDVNEFVFQTWTCDTHLDSSSTYYWQEATEYDDFVRDFGNSTQIPIVMGDFNFKPGSPPGGSAM